MGVVEGLHCSGRSVFLLEEKHVLTMKEGRKKWGEDPYFT